jgi:small subunit ribosomal protein S17
MRENRRTIIGEVVSNKMNKTVVVEIKTRKPHRLYHRIVNRTDRFKAHDEENRCNLGDFVRLIESKPISKDKHWQVAEVLTKGHVAELRPQEIGRTEVEEVLPVRTQEAAEPAVDASPAEEEPA